MGEGLPSLPELSLCQQPPELHDPPPGGHTTRFAPPTVLFGDGIEKLYRELEMVNIHFMNRLRDATRKDATSNALYIFLTLTSLIAMDINSAIKSFDPIMKRGL